MANALESPHVAASRYWSLVDVFLVDMFLVAADMMGPRALARR